MAFLDPDDEEFRNAWLSYAIEFARRGLWLEGEIETHGPHRPPADRVWGRAWVRDEYGVARKVEFETPRGRGGLGDLRGLRMLEKTGGERERFPVLPQHELSARLRHRLARAERELVRRTARRRH